MYASICSDVIVGDCGGGGPDDGDHPPMDVWEPAVIRLRRQEPVMVPVVYSGPSSVPEVDRDNVDY